MSGGNADYEAIVALLHAHRIALWMRDFEAYSACFVHAPSTSRWAVFRQKDVGIMRGWDEIAARARAFVADDPLPYRKNAFETTIDDLTLHIGGDIAWASYVQNYPGEYLHGSDEGLFGPVGGTNELRILEKHEGCWKIAFLGFIEPNLKSFAGTLVRVDAQSRILWNNEVAEAEFANGDDLMRINGRLRLRDRRLDGRLRTAIKWASANGSFMPRRAAPPCRWSCNRAPACRRGYAGSPPTPAWCWCRSTTATASPSAWKPRLSSLGCRRRRAAWPNISATA
jgi:hypothetical protein